MKFAHLADCHLGGWREPALREANLQTFEMVVEQCIENKVDFVVIAGDLFNNPFPPLDVTKRCARSLRMLRDNHIPVYVVPGSHDYTVGGKTYIDVFHEGGLLVNLAKDGIPHIVKDSSGCSLTGMMGLRGGLDKEEYEKIDREKMSKINHPKIFVFHCLLAELKNIDVEGMPSSLLPQGFDYYAGGHEHECKIKGNIAYPGPLFPNNFAELASIQHGSYLIVDNFIPAIVSLPNKVVHMTIACDNLLPEEVVAKAIATREDVKDAFVLLRFAGVMDDPGKINYRRIIDHFKEHGARSVLRNVSALESKSLADIKMPNTVKVEDAILKEKAKDVSRAKKWMDALSMQLQDGETRANYEKRVVDEVSALLFDDRPDHARNTCSHDKRQQ